jgi:hypothetical protein
MEAVQTFQKQKKTGLAMQNISLQRGRQPASTKRKMRCTLQKSSPSLWSRLNASSREVYRPISAFALSCLSSVSGSINAVVRNARLFLMSLNMQKIPHTRARLAVPMAMVRIPARAS